MKNNKWVEGPDNLKEINFISTEIKEFLNKKISGNYNLFLQGSKKKGTNIKEFSDIDFLISEDSLIDYDEGFEELKNKEGFIDSNFEEWESQSHLLKKEIPKKYERILSGNQGTLDEYKKLKNKILEALKENKNIKNIKIGSKSIKIKYERNAKNWEIDLVPCLYYIHISNNKEIGNGGISIGISSSNNNIWDERFRDIERIVNYPKINIHNSAIKNEKTKFLYKKIIRWSKNFLNKEFIYEYDSKFITGNLIENIIYNVPDKYFESEESFRNIFKYISENIESIIKNYNSLNQYEPSLSNEIEDIKLNKKRIKKFFKSAFNYI